MKVIRSLAVIIILSVVTGMFIGCGSVETKETTKEVIEKSYYPITIIDSIGNEVTLESEPMKVISVAPSITEILFAIGVGDRQIGKTEYCNYPPEAKDIEIIGSLQEPNIELIVSMKPDIVIAAAHFPEEVVEKFQEVGIKVAVLYGEESFEGVYESIRKVAELFNVVDAGETVVDNMTKKVNDIVEAVSIVNKKYTVYYALSAGESDYTATGETFISDMLEMAGGVNIASDATGWGYNKELLLEKDPDIIITSDYLDPEEFKKMEPYNELSASKNNRVYGLSNPDLIVIAGPRIADGLLELAEIFYPEVFNK